MALDGGSLFPLALGRRLFVELAGAKLGQKTGFFDCALEAAKRGLEGLVFADADTGHEVDCLSIPEQAEPISIAIERRPGKAGKLNRYTHASQRYARSRLRDFL